MKKIWLALILALLIVAQLYSNPKARAAPDFTNVLVQHDSHIDENYPNNNNGAYQWIYLGRDPMLDPAKRIRGVLYSDLSGIPPGSSVVTARIYLRFGYKGAGFMGATVTAYRLTTSFQEGTVTWDHPWTTPGGDFGPSIGSVTIPAAASDGDLFYINVPGFAQDVVDGSVTNRGILLTSTSSDWHSFYSKEGSVPAYRPYIRVEYTPPAPATITVDATPFSRTVIQGGSTTYAVDVGGTFSGAANLDATWTGGVPAGVVEGFTPSSGTIPFTSTYSVQTSASTPPGTYDIQIRGQVPGSALSDSDTVQLVVTTPPPPTQPPPLTTTPPPPTPAPPSPMPSPFEFQIDVSRGELTLEQGDSGSIDMNVSQVSACEAIALSLSGLPEDAAYWFSPASIIPGEDSVLFITAGSTTGSYQALVTATAGDLTKSATIAVTITKKGLTLPCIIVTATYGSELAPEVQALRAFRDEKIMTTYAGSQFMRVFNAWYYSFSPEVAAFISERPSATTATKIALYPLLGILRVASSATVPIFRVNAELGAIAAGLVVSSLIGVVYFSPLISIALFAYRRYMGRSLKVSWLKYLLVPLAASFILLCVGVISRADMLTALSTAFFVLTTLALASLSAATSIASLLGGKRNKQPNCGRNER